MRKSRNNFKKRKIMLFLTTAVIFTVSFTIIKIMENKIEPKIREICTYYCKMQLSKISNEAVEEIMTDNNITYSDLAVKLMDGGDISAIEIRTENVNKIQAQIVKKIQKKLEEKSKNEISIPIGTISNSYFFSAKGPKIKIKYLPECSVSTDIRSDFSSAGINQTCHKISIGITAETIIILPSDSFLVSADSECILAENIIIGTVPEGLISNF